MKKISILLLIALTLPLIFSLFSCTQSGGENADKPVLNKYETKNLNVYNWGEYISNEDDEEYGLFDVNRAFEDYFNTNLADKYQCYIKVNYST